ncbi:MAG: NAD-glutamate dehydrogenase domain-containing protein, partial [Pseudomonadota bacterium]
MTRSTERMPEVKGSQTPEEGLVPNLSSSAASQSARAVSERISSQLSDPAIEAFAGVLFANSDLHAVSQLSDIELVDLVTSAHEFIGSRSTDTHKIRLRALSPSDAQSGGLIIEILNDDMPFLVDSIVGELRAHHVDVDLLLHPIVSVRHGSDGSRSVSQPSGSENGARTTNESLMIIVARHLSTAQATEVKTALDEVLKLVRHAVVDWQAMLKLFGAAVAEFADNKAIDHNFANSEFVEFCHWLLVGNFTFLGLRQYNLEGDTETGRLVPDMSSALGVLRDPNLQVLSQSGEELELTPESRRYVFADEPLIMTKSDIPSRIHRRSNMDYIGLKTYDDNGRQVGELRLVGLLTSNAYTERPSAIPLLRRKVEDVVQRMGISSGSHDGKALLNVLENFPRDELFRIDNTILMKWARAILDLDLRPRVRVFARRDRFDRFVSVLVYVPRERFSTGAREKIGDVLCDAFAGHVSAFTPFFPESPLIRVHYIIGRDRNKKYPDTEVLDLEAQITELTTNWNHRLADAMDAQPDVFGSIKKKYEGAFSAGYTERFSVESALQDISRIERLSDDLPVAIDFRASRGGTSRVNATVYRFDEPIPLSERVPVLENFGFRAIDERSYHITPKYAGGVRSIVLHDMELDVEDGNAVDLADEGVRLEAGFLAVRCGLAADDSFNQLIHAAKLDWREANLFRAYAAYLRQTGVPFGFRYLSETIVSYPEIARDLIGLYRARFDPETGLPVEHRLELSGEIERRIEEALAAVPNLDEDRIIRHFLGLIQATLRSNFFHVDGQGRPLSVLSFKFDPQKISWLPAPRPYREIWVYSPRVEGVHLRFGPIARGGLRWSDRAQDFRTEVLGLCKAQQVKNTVIVPEGSKGGFYPKQLPRTGDRGQIVAEAVESYRLFVSTMLQLTDNVIDGKIVPPGRTVRYDGDDPYLVVAADKGTATFSDYANEISEGHDYWLGDAFASGGSAGYDHKKMGITARGGWESVKRLFREMDHNIQTTPFTVAGVGDMSGDVFGNGMLLSPAIKLVAAFDHRDIFIDPDPDPESSFAERQRLFNQGQSSWQDYDQSKISAGGGVFSRQAKEIKLSPEIQSVLGVEIASVTPLELLRLILKAKVDLLWFAVSGPISVANLKPTIQLVIEPMILSASQAVRLE